MNNYMSYIALSICASEIFTQAYNVQYYKRGKCLKAS